MMVWELSMAIRQDFAFLTCFTHKKYDVADMMMWQLQRWEFAHTQSSPYKGTRFGAVIAVYWVHVSLPNSLTWCAWHDGVTAEHNHSPTTWKLVALINSFVNISCMWCRVSWAWCWTNWTAQVGTKSHGQNNRHTRKNRPPNKRVGELRSTSQFFKKNDAILGRSSVCFGH